MKGPERKSNMRKRSTAARKTPVVLIDREASFRGLLQEFLERPGRGFRVVATEGFGKETVALCRKHAAELLIIDHCLPDAACAEVIGRLLRALPQVRVLLASCSISAGLAEAIEAGAHGCVLKEEPLEELQSAIAAVVAGETWFSPKVAATCGAGAATLTARQAQILHLIVSGLSTRRIATRLKITYKTTDHHRTRIMKKLGVHDLASLVRQAILSGLVEL